MNGWAVVATTSSSQFIRCNHHTSDFNDSTSVTSKETNMSEKMSTTEELVKQAILFARKAGGTTKEWDSWAVEWLAGPTGRLASFANFAKECSGGIAELAAISAYHAAKARVSEANAIKYARMALA